VIERIASDIQTSRHKVLLQAANTVSLPLLLLLPVLVVVVVVVVVVIVVVVVVVERTD